MGKYYNHEKKKCFISGIIVISLTILFFVNILVPNINNATTEKQIENIYSDNYNEKLDTITEIPSCTNTSEPNNNDKNNSDITINSINNADSVYLSDEDAKALSESIDKDGIKINTVCYPIDTNQNDSVYISEEDAKALSESIDKDGIKINTVCYPVDSDQSDSVYISEEDAKALSESIDKDSIKINTVCYPIEDISY